MLGPYTARRDGTISYKGNAVFEPIDNVLCVCYPTADLEQRVLQLRSSTMWGKVARINHRINLTVNQYFDKIGAYFTPLPLVTRMISSPGAVYGTKAISYTTDTSPIRLKWFGLERTAFLAESSQIYLELALLQQGVDQVYVVYNSFRKEKADPTHLSEFHHVEYEGKLQQEQNATVAMELVRHVINDLLEHNERDVASFLPTSRLYELSDMATKIHATPNLTFAEALRALYNATRDDKYTRFTMDGTFGSWEEVKLTEIVGGMVRVSEFPLLEVPFYHAEVDGSEPKVADNSDIIWPGYREFIGSGHRVRSVDELKYKARTFDLPMEDYEPYLQSRESPQYVETSGFGLGWERLLQGLLEMPFIWSACQFPRGHTTLKP